MNGYKPVFLLFSLLWGAGLYVGAYCLYGWWGVLAVAVFGGLVGPLARSEVVQSALRARRARRRVRRRGGA